MIDAIRDRLAGLGLPVSEAREAAATNAGWLIAERLLSGLLAGVGRDPRGCRSG